MLLHRHAHRPCLSAFKEEGGKTRQETVCALLQEFTTGLFAAKSNMESLTSWESTHFCLTLASLRFCLWRWPIRQLLLPPLQRPQPSVIKIPLHRRNRKSIRNHWSAYIRVPAVFFLLLFLFWLLSLLTVSSQRKGLFVMYKDRHISHCSGFDRMSVLTVGFAGKAWKNVNIAVSTQLFLRTEAPCWAKHAKTKTKPYKRSWVNLDRGKGRGQSMPLCMLQQHVLLHIGN